jgi:hypothetical protein
MGGKSVSAQEVRSPLTSRKLIQSKLLDVECSIRAVLCGFGLKVGAISRGRFETRIRELVEGATQCLAPGLHSRVSSSVCIANSSRSCVRIRSVGS